MSTNYNPSVISDGLVLYVDAANIKSYPGSGLTWYDLSGNAKHGTLTNGPLYSSGAIVFDGSNDYINIGDIGSPQQFTFSAWINVTELDKDANNNYRRILTNSANTAIILIEEAGSISFRIPGHTTQTNYNAGLVSLNTWTLVTCVYNQDYRTIYQNGVFKGQNQIGPTTVSFGNVQIGSADAQAFKGYISNCSIYNRALSATEVAQNFNAIRGRYGL